MHSLLIINKSNSDPETCYKPFTNEEVITVTAVAPANTVADQALATFKVKKPCHASPEPKDVIEEPEKEQAKIQISTTSNKVSVNSVKPPIKPTPAPKPTKKHPVQKCTVQCSTIKGK
jgi:hypothetical protein